MPEDKTWTRPILRWAGSKRKAVPTLRSLMPTSFQRYVEPFAGSACLFFAVRPPSALLGDVNVDLINTYDMLRRHPRLLSRRVAEIPNTEAAYYRARTKLRTETDAFERSALFVYLNRHCFNGVYRTNREGHFNVPRGSHTGSIPSAQEFYRSSIALRQAKLVAADFRTSADSVTRGDFVYLDPPYSSSERSRYGEYGYPDFKPADLLSITKVLKKIDKAGAKFLLSYADGKEARTCLSHWRLRSMSTRRHVAGFADRRQSVAELIVSNY